MTDTYEIPFDAKHRQQVAASPVHSAWVSANAGSGKTEILVQRVIRLLLDGTQPSSILCVTFTKAAAAEMMNRIFKRLSEWISLPNIDLIEALEKLTGRKPSPSLLVRARSLFADALETPGGLKIQTIHAFCEHILHLFPFEANAPANFTVMDQAEQIRLQQSILANLVSDMAKDTGDSRKSIQTIAETIRMDSLHDLANEALANKALLANFNEQFNHRETYENLLRQLSMLNTGDTPDSVCDEFFQLPYWALPAQRMIKVLQNDATPTNRNTGTHLSQISAIERSTSRFDFLIQHLITKDGNVKKQNTLITSNFRKQYPAESVLFDDMVSAAILARDKIFAIQSIAISWAGITFLSAFIQRYQSAKALRGALDFDDLILKTRALLYRGDIAPWILYKLDTGLSHILVDEAQDTSPEQWDIIIKLSEEFTAGESSGADNRTIFAVGDEKQSIYGFQGAAPDAFGRTKELMKSRHRNALRALEDVRLLLSFRSTEEVLSAVDATFAHGDYARGLIFDQAAGVMPHESLRYATPGFVELWPQEHGTKADDSVDPWLETSDIVQAVSAHAALATRIAKYIQHLLHHGDPAGQTVRAGDIMILVRHRSALFETLIQQLKLYGLPVAGADRLKLKSHIAVQDLLALGRACTIPDDDFNLAVLLKSPLFSLSDEDLLEFAPLRTVSLDQALRMHMETTGKFREAWDRLQRWRAYARKNGPFAFFSYVLEADGGRRAMLQRLGPEAIDAINEFLRRSHDFEIQRHASLIAFLIEFEDTDIEIKRDFDHASNEIRVMTVHAAKGLEAPIVILPDTMTPPKSHKARILGINHSGMTIPFWSPSGRREPAFTQSARAWETLETDNEYRRLLYVAMTRAQNGLVICGARHDDAKSGSWYHMISTALRAAQEKPDARRRGHLQAVDGFDGGPVERWVVQRPQQAKAIRIEKSGNADDADAPVSIPDWLFQPAPQPVARRSPLLPSKVEWSDAATAKADPIALQAARSRGRLAHTLLEHLPTVPPAERAAVAEVIARRMLDEESAQHNDVISQVLTLLDQPELDIVFGPQAQSEVAVSGRITMANGAIQPILGVIDRLAVTDEAVWIADFKTSPVPPRHAQATPASIVAQLALYRAALRDIFPDKPVRCLVIWTAGPAIHELTDAQMDAAIAHVTAA